MKEYTNKAEQDFQANLDEIIGEIRTMLIQKNKSYGSSAIDPIRIFSKMDAVEQLKVRMDDKLSRLARGTSLSNESMDDTVRDLVGYLFIYLMQTRVQQQNHE